MIGYGLSDVLVRWILSMLDSRRRRTKFGLWTSDIFGVSSALPQGPPLSCIWFNSYTSDIIDWTEVDGTHPFLYVDDVIISCESD